MFPPLLVARFNSLFFLSIIALAQAATDPIPISVPPTAPTHNVVQSNFLGPSFELSFMTEYFGNDTSTIPPTIVNYLSAIRDRVGNNPLRIRVGGNSMDSSTYVSTLTTPMIQFTTSAANDNNQPVNYGPMLWDVMKTVADNVGGAQYLIAAAEQTLGDALDAYLLGNEPDLYTPHYQRPNIANYTTEDYINDWTTVTSRLTNTSAGNLLSPRRMGGPTICCDWKSVHTDQSSQNLDALLSTDGYLATFDTILKYISVQHYPQDDCSGSYAFGVSHYIQHANVVSLATWQTPAIDLLQSNTSADRPDLIMSEFNSAACGGVPGVSDTFAVGSMWTVDYALQMASVGYSAAYLHTRERGISYNMFVPPAGPDGSPGDWTTNPPYYSLLVTAEALSSSDGAGGVVVDLNISNSMSDTSATTAGYVVYDSKGMTVNQFVLFNYANVSNFATPSAATATFSLPADAFSGDKTSITVKYLSASSLMEEYNIAWGGQSLVGVGNGTLVDDTASWVVPNQQINCADGCSVDVPATALAVVFAGGVTTSQVNNTNSAEKPQTTPLNGHATATATTAGSQISIQTNQSNQTNKALSAFVNPALFIVGVFSTMLAFVL
ncbi:hypothetical protein H0H92_010989 [Tricholoma furcatifolium]|nr:hypothetical protein H0H92_010989 [Tricholoma furcatifolium]